MNTKKRKQQFNFLFSCIDGKWNLIRDISPCEKPKDVLKYFKNRHPLVTWEIKTIEI